MAQINTITAPEGMWLNRGEIWVKTISSYGDTSDWVVKTQEEKDKWDAEHPEDEPNMPGGGIDDCSTKANIDGYYESMRVGTADNLTPRGDASEEIIMNRTAGGNNAVESGDASIESIKGNSVVMTQLVKKPYYEISIKIEDNNGELYVIPESAGNRLQAKSRVTAITGHLYLQMVRIKTSGTTVRFANYLGGLGLVTSGTSSLSWVWLYEIARAKNSEETLVQIWSSDVTPYWIKDGSFNLIDLTQMFGAGNEPATLEEFAHRLGYDSVEQIPYIPYNEGEIVSCKAEGIRTTDAEGDTYERKWTSTLQKYFPCGLQSVGNVYDEITPGKAIKRISNDREILQQPEEYPYDELNLSMRVAPDGKEEAIIPKGVLSTPLRMDVVYPIDAYATIVDNKQHIGSLDKLTTTSKTDLVSAVNELKEVLSTLAVKSESNERNITQLRADTDGIITDWGGVDNRTLPLLCGQPMILFGHGAPAKEAVPDNWIQFNPVSGQGYDWNGKPSALGQQYLDVDVSVGGFYIAARDKDMGLKWINC